MLENAKIINSLNAYFEYWNINSSIIYKLGKKPKLGNNWENSKILKMPKSPFSIFDFKICDHPKNACTY